jgi:predicted secreted Zn-dependent protease
MLPAAALAQMDSYMEMLRTDVRAEKVAVITEVMAFTDAESELFWPVYRQYELDLAKIFDTRLANIKKYAENSETLDDVTADELINTAFKVDENRTKLQKSYYSKFKKALGAKRAARFMQLESQIDLLIDLQIAANLPLIGEE